MVMSIANALSPAVGGILGDAVGWRIVFGIQVVIALVVGSAAWRWLPETRVSSPAAQKKGVFSASIRLARDRAFLGYALQTGVLYAIFFVFISLVPYIFRNLGRSSTEYGSWYVLISFSYFCGNWYTTRHSFRIGLDRIITRGIALQTLGAITGVGLAVCGLWHPAFLFLPWCVIGFAQGLTLPNLTAAGVGRSTLDAGAASGLLGFGQQIIGAIAVQAMANASTTTPVPVTAFIAGGAVVAASVWWLTPAHIRMPPAHPPR
jgi:DHA1 family bicyclomycin/chloramphenicol resistance-like MFS transporter